MSARNGMTMRAEIERDNQATEDSLGHDLPPNWQNHITVDCIAWSFREKETVDEKYAAISLVGIQFPLSADITNEDRVKIVKDRRGATKFPGPLTIESLVPRRTHLEATCRAVA